MDIQEIKEYLKIDEGYTGEDSLLTTLVNTAEEYIYNATSKKPNYNNKLYKMAVLLYVADQYENRVAVNSNNKQGYKFGLENILTQLELIEDWEV